MVANDSIQRLPAGKIAAVVTYLEMTDRPVERPRAQPSGLDLRRLVRPDLDAYRALFRRVGQNWLWFSRLSLTDHALAAILHHPAEEVYVLARGGLDVGLLELDFRSPPDCEVAFLGLTAAAIGQGAGAFLIEFAVSRAWSRMPAISRLFVHTCTLDHPNALDFYQRAGFKPYGRAVEIADDPRLDGRLPRAAAPWLPML